MNQEYFQKIFLKVKKTNLMKINKYETKKIFFSIIIKFVMIRNNISWNIRNIISYRVKTTFLVLLLFMLNLVVKINFLVVYISIMHINIEIKYNKVLYIFFLFESLKELIRRYIF